MKKFFLWLFIIILFSIIGFLIYLYFKPITNREPYKVIPPDVIYIIETSDLTKGWEQLKQNTMWKHLTKSEYFKEINSSIEKLDSLIKNNNLISEMFSNRQLLISSHMTDKNNYDFLIIVDLKKGAKITFLKDYINEIIKLFGYKLTTENYNGSEITILTEISSGDNLYFTFIDNLMLVSFNKNILYSAVEENKKDKGGIISDEMFEVLLTKTSSKGLFSIRINYSKISEFLNVYLSEPSELMNDLSKILEYSSFEINIGEERITFKGYTNINPKEKSYLKVLLDTKPAKFEATEIISSDAAMYLSLSFEKFTDFLTKSEEEFNTYDNYENISKNIERIEKFFKINLREDFFSWIGNEIAFVMLKPSGLIDSKEILVLIKTSNIEKAKNGLEKITKQIKRRSPLKFRKFEYNGYEIEYLDIKNFFRLFLGKLFDKLEKPFFTYIKDYIVFSNSPENLTNFIDDYISGKTLKNNKKFNEFVNKFNQTANVSIFIQMPKMYTYMFHYANQNTKNSLRKNREYIVSFARIGFQLTSIKDMFETTLTSDYEIYTANIDNLEKIETTEDLMNIQIEAKLFKVDTSYGEIHKDGTYQIKYPNGNVKCEWSVKNGALDGISKLYWENGKIRTISTYSNGTLEGEAKFYSSDGTLKAECIFKNDMIHGDYIEYYENGQTKAILQYKKGKPNGKAQYFYPNGKIKIEGEFSEGLKDGKWTYFLENGKSFMKKRFNKGVEK